MIASELKINEICLAGAAGKGQERKKEEGAEEQGELVVRGESPAAFIRDEVGHLHRVGGNESS